MSRCKQCHMEGRHKMSCTDESNPTRKDRVTMPASLKEPIVEGGDMNILQRIAKWLTGPEVISVTVEASPVKADKYKCTIEWDDGRKCVALGDITVFHSYPDGTRLSTDLEALCSDAVTAHQWREPC